MPSLWKKIQNLFRPDSVETHHDASLHNIPAIHEIIERSEAEKNDYAQWRQTLVRRRLVDWLSQQYAISTVLPNDVDEGFDFLDTPSSKGFVIHFYKTNYSLRDTTYFFDYLKEQVLQLEYWPQISDTRTYNRPEWVETVERHYLKPKPDFSHQHPPVNQRFGNITIENILCNNQPYHLKFRVNSYNDHLFSQPEDFHELMQAILA
ncbi:MAG: hypothetical protein HUU34_18790 [Saprospiraceae bacterium]|jgi:hypothetical protein|nr:hypothetical protein [Saprospiraceae bacterium]